MRLLVRRYPAAAEDAAGDGDGRGVARGDDDWRRQGLTTHGSGGEEQLLDLSAGFPIARATVVDLAASDEDARRGPPLQPEPFAGDSDRLPAPGGVVDPLARKYQQRGGGHEQDQFQHQSTADRRVKNAAATPASIMPAATAADCQPDVRWTVGTSGDEGRLYCLRFAAEDEDRMRAADAAIPRIVHPGVVHPTRTKVLDPACGSLTQNVKLAELNRLRRARRCARRLQSRLLPVVAEGALECPPIVGPPIDHAERAGDDAVAAAVADVGLDEDAAELGPDDRSRGTGLEAAGVLAVLAHVGREVPAERVAAVAAVSGPDGHLAALDELHVAPRRVAEARCVVVRESREREPVVGNAVPLLARDLAGLAADAQRRVGEEGGYRHWSRAVTLQSSPFASMILTFGSSEMATRSLTTSPRTRPRPPK